MSSEKKIETPVKKRSVYKPRDLLDFPQWAKEDKKNSYRWRSLVRLEEFSDEYDPEGWVIAKDADGKKIKRMDLILCSMPIDQYRALKDYQDEMKRTQVDMVLQAQNDAEDRLTHEFKKAGGRVKTEFTFEQ